MIDPSLPEIPLLVIGYGDKRKADNSAGRYVAEAIKNKSFKYIQALSVYNLSSSLASRVATAKIVIFVGTYRPLNDMKPEIIIKHFLPHYDQPDIGISYPNPPYSLLSFIKKVYGKQPDAYWILIPALNDQPDQEMSYLTQKAIRSTLEYLIGDSDQQSFSSKAHQQCAVCPKPDQELGVTSNYCPIQ
jgi:Ni,Fe-hydrogenase maturation factor